MAFIHAERGQGFATPARVLAILCLSLSLFGCPYETSTPLGPPEEAVIDQQLIGSWECRSGKGDEAWSLSVFRFDSRQYYLYTTAEGEPPSHFRAYGTIVEGISFLNVIQLDTTDAARGERYWFLHYAVEDGQKLVVRIVWDALLKDVSDAASVRAAVSRQITNPHLYEDFCSCRRIPVRGLAAAGSEGDNPGQASGIAAPGKGWQGHTEDGCLSTAAGNRQ